MIEIREVVTKKQRKEFVEFPLKLYKNNPYFVPPLYGDEMQIFQSNYVYNEQCDSVFFNAYQDGKMVGRISGILQKAANEKWNQKRVRFTRFDCIDDQDVADALFKTVEEWALTKGMTEVVGPLGYSDLEREGLLIEGFDQLSTFEEQYNYPYYQKLIENCGYGKDVDWVERKLFKPAEVDERIVRLSERMMKKYNLHRATAKNTREFLKKYADPIFEILDQTYDKIYGTVPFTEGMKKMMLSNFKLILNMNYIGVIVDENDKIVCFGFCMPSIAKAVQKSGGRLTPGAICRLLKAIRHPEVIDLALIGVLPEYQMKGISTVLIYEIIRMLSDGKIQHAETNLNLEDNYAIQNQWKSFDNVLHKRRRCFIKHLHDDLAEL